MRARSFSDNAFTLLPWQNKTVQFVGEGPFSLADLQRSLSVLSIADTLPSAQMQDLSLPNLNVRIPCMHLLTPRRPDPQGRSALQGAPQGKSTRCSSRPWCFSALLVGSPW